MYAHIAQATTDEIPYTGIAQNDGQLRRRSPIVRQTTFVEILPTLFTTMLTSCTYTYVWFFSICFCAFRFPKSQKDFPLVARMRWLHAVVYIGWPGQRPL